MRLIVGFARMLTLRLLLPATAGLLLGGCGQIGPLTLPPDSAQDTPPVTGEAPPVTPAGDDDSTD